LPVFYFLIIIKQILVEMTKIKQKMNKDMPPSPLSSIPEDENNVSSLVKGDKTSGEETVEAKRILFQLPDGSTATAATEKEKIAILEEYHENKG
jgi:hypothetical protein